MMGGTAASGDMLMSFVWWGGITVVVCAITIKMYGRLLAK